MTELVNKESVTKDTGDTAARYIGSCRREFWQKVFRLETEYLAERLKGCRDILSVGCGPAFIEGALAERGFRVTGLDVSREALDRAPDTVRTVAARAEDMPFPESSFDAVISVVSLQFVEDYRQALGRSASVLRPSGRIILMLLNPRSRFFMEKFRDPGSYVSRIRHMDLAAIEEAAAGLFSVNAEYFLDIAEEEVSAGAGADDSALYVISGVKRGS